MLTTRNFRDILHIARHKRPHNFSLHFDVPWQSRPLVKRRQPDPRHRAHPAAGRPGRHPARRERRARSDPHLQEARHPLRRHRLPLLLHQRRARAARPAPSSSARCRRPTCAAPRTWRTCSGSTNASPTAAMNAFIGPRTSLYLTNLRDQLARQGFRANLRLIQSNGGVSTVEAVLAAGRQHPHVGAGGRGHRGAGGRAAGRCGQTSSRWTSAGTSADISTVPGGRIKIMNPRDSYVSGHPDPGTDDRPRDHRGGGADRSPTSTRRAASTWGRARRAPTPAPPVTARAATSRRSPTPRSPSGGSTRTRCWGATFPSTPTSRAAPSSARSERSSASPSRTRPSASSG